MADIFISYAADDIETARDLATMLESDFGLIVWWDRGNRSGLHVGHNYITRIAQELNEAGAVIVIWTARSISSEWVLAEAETARAAHKIIPVRVGQLNLSKIPPPFNIIQTCELNDVETLRKALVGLRRRSPTQLKIERDEIYSGIQNGLNRETPARWEKLVLLAAGEVRRNVIARGMQSNPSEWVGPREDRTHYGMIVKFLVEAAKLQKINNVRLRIDWRATSPALQGLQSCLNASAILIEGQDDTGLRPILKFTVIGTRY